MTINLLEHNFTRLDELIACRRAIAWYLDWIAASIIHSTIAITTSSRVHIRIMTKGRRESVNLSKRQAISGNGGGGR